MTTTTYAAIGTDGTRNVVWGIGSTESAALADAAEQDGAPDELTTRTITTADVEAIEAGDVDAASLGRGMNLSAALATYARETVADVGGDYASAVRAMDDEPGEVAAALECSVEDVQGWCDRESAEAPEGWIVYAAEDAGNPGVHEAGHWYYQPADWNEGDVYSEGYATRAAAIKAACNDTSNIESDDGSSAIAVIERE